MSVENQLNCVVHDWSNYWFTWCNQSKSIDQCFLAEGMLAKPRSYWHVYSRMQMTPACETCLQRQLPFKSHHNHLTFSECPLLVRSSPNGSAVENLPAIQETWGCGINPWVRKIFWRRKWHLTPVFLHGKSHGQRSPGGYSPWGRKELARTEHRQKPQHYWPDSILKALYFPSHSGLSTLLWGDSFYYLLFTYKKSRLRVH